MTTTNIDSITNKSFPMQVFPPELQEITNEYAASLNINIDYACGVVLFAFASALGASYSLRIKKGWEEMPTLFCALVGKAGINKSSPVSILTKPLEKTDKELYDVFIDKWKKYKQQIAGKETKEDKLFEVPVRKQIVIKDTTQEALLQALYNNPRGLAGVYDELGAFLKSFNKYRPGGGGDEEVMLSLFSGKSLSINRKNTEPLLIPTPYFSVIGSIQPNVMTNLLGNSRIDNGLTHRFLYIYPDNVIREDLSDKEVSDIAEEMYYKMISYLIKPGEILADNHTHITIGLSADAMEVYKRFRRRINTIINNEKSDAISGIYAKLDTYFFRLALVIHMMRIACKEERVDKLRVCGSTAERTEQLIDYFEYMALKVFRLLSKHRDPLADYPLEHKILYYKLPATFTTAEAWLIAHEKISKRTFYNFLSDDYLFTKLRHGSYEKVW